MYVMPIMALSINALIGMQIRKPSGITAYCSVHLNRYTCIHDRHDKYYIYYVYTYL